MPVPVYWRWPPAHRLPRCGAGNRGAAPATELPTVVLWSSYSGKNGETEQTLVDRFNEAYAGEVQVDYQVQGSYEETATKVTAALQAQTAPDIALLSDVWWFKFYMNQALVALDDLTLVRRSISSYQDSLISEGLRQGQHWWVPFARSTPLFYYNKEKWANAGLPDRGPETWDEFMEWAPKLIEKDGDEMTVAAFEHPDGASYICMAFPGRGLAIRRCVQRS
ncbi:MAG: extracellular solute-binding protein [Caldilineaceae bacterium]